MIIVKCINAAKNYRIKKRKQRAFLVVLFKVIV